MATSKPNTGAARRRSGGRASVAVAALVAVLSSLLTVPAFAVTISSATFSGATGTATVGGTLYAKEGAALTLSVKTSSDTDCVRVYNPGSTTHLLEAKTTGQTSGQENWAFSLTGEAGDGTRSYTVKAWSTRSCNDPDEHSQTASYVRDNTAPSLSGKATTSPNGHGWYNSDVTVAWTCSDNGGSGLDGSCPANSTITGEGANLSATATVKDKVGNEQSAKVGGIQIDRTAPTTSVSALPAWNNEDVTVTLTATDNLAGVYTTSYQLNGGDVQTGTSVSISEEGIHTLSFWSVDKADHVEAANKITVRIDKTSPTISSSQDPGKNGDGWNNTDVKVSFLCDDNRSGIASCTSPQDVSAEGKNQEVTGEAVDKAGNRATAHHFVSIDRTPPTISAAADRGPNANGWYNAAVTVDFTCDDELSGVKECPSAITLPEEGADQGASGTAYDAADNNASAGVSGINIDLTAPTTSDDAPTEWTNASSVTVTLSATDTGGSGVDATYYSVNGGEEVLWIGTAVAFSDEGVHTLQYWSVDRAGNVEAARTTEVGIDRTPPATISDAPTGWQTSAVTVTLDPSDDASGVAATHYTVNGGDEQTWTGTGIHLTKEGGHQLAFWSVDHAGNVETAQSAEIKIDLYAPSVAITSPDDGSTTTATSVTVAVTASDSASGVADVTVNKQAATYDASSGTFSASVTLVCGSNQLIAQATDRVARTSTHAINVTRTCGSVEDYLAPLQASSSASTQLNAVKKNRVVPVKVTITKDGAAYTGSNASSLPKIEVRKLTSCSDSDGTVNEVTETAGSANSGTEFRWSDEGHWIYNLGTSNLETGKCYRLDVTIDGTRISSAKWAVLNVTK